MCIVCWMLRVLVLFCFCWRWQSVKLATLAVQHFFHSRFPSNLPWLFMFHIISMFHIQIWQFFLPTNPNNSAFVQHFCILGCDECDGTQGRWWGFIFFFSLRWDKCNPIAGVIYLNLAKCHAAHCRNVRAKREFGICEGAPTHLGKLKRRAGRPLCSELTRN